MSSNNNSLLGILAATAVGAALGVLFAPDKGVNTRKKIVDEAQNAKENLTREASILQHKITDTVVAQKDTLDTKVESLVSDASYKAEDLITTLEKKLNELKAKNKKLQKS
ncbi:YtxH domain-containing protein [Aquimarina sp. AD1]|uniref:YtxH domain-containing protein n=1 Tax=Aquimarina TaxID=290174 RepID=UPI0003FD534E|nr:MULTISPECIES: YtxH domain-containing protein [Aquimarina]AXT57157.1 YtxH domain-containing protein [Aquimarina sp. AD1]RKN35855.1 YtxH domain-containing protein [Aquimarina sp. AD1]